LLSHARLGIKQSEHKEIADLIFLIISKHNGCWADPVNKINFIIFIANELQKFVIHWCLDSKCFLVLFDLRKIMIGLIDSIDRIELPSDLPEQIKELDDLIKNSTEGKI
jgi:hypothetical protein